MSGEGGRQDFQPTTHRPSACGLANFYMRELGCVRPHAILYACGLLVLLSACGLELLYVLAAFSMRPLFIFFEDRTDRPSACGLKVLCCVVGGKGLAPLEVGPAWLGPGWGVFLARWFPGILGSCLPSAFYRIRF